MFCGSRYGFDCLRNREVGTLSPLFPLSLNGPEGEGERRREAEVDAIAPTSASSSVLRGRERMLCCGVWVCILFCLLGFGLAMEGPGLGCRTSMAPTPTLVASAVVLPFPSRMPWETCRCRGRLCVGTSVLRISARPLSGTAYRLEAAVGGWSRIRALKPCITSRKTRGIPRRG